MSKNIFDQILNEQIINQDLPMETMSSKPHLRNHTSIETLQISPLRL